MTVPTCFREVWFVDTEYLKPDGERPKPICLTAKEYRSGDVVRMWLWEQHLPESPLADDPGVLVVAYNAMAEWSVYLALGWELPVRILDLHAEFRWLMSGFKGLRHGQLDAMEAFGLPHMEDFYKSDMRALCCRGGPFSDSEARQIMGYCEEDVDGLAALFDKMEPGLQWPQAIARGRYTAALAKVEDTGVPLDRDLHLRIRRHREAIRRELVSESEAEFGLYDDDTSFDTKAFGQWLAREGIAWPRTPTGKLVEREEVFEEMVDIYPQLRPLYELRSAMSQLKDDGGLSVGLDGRNRDSLRPFCTSTGRNAPSTTKFVFGKSTAFRSLIKPGPGWCVSYLDWQSQEFAIAAILSDDHNMRRAYASGDPYMEFARQAGAVPSSATKETHGEVREQFKACMLAVNYSMGVHSLARRLKRPLAYARELLGLHHSIYSGYWKWVEKVLNQAMLTSRLQTVFGWQVNVGRKANGRSLKNFAVQAGGADMLRLALCLAVERGVRVVAPVHDALMIEAPQDDIALAVAKTREAMAEASRIVLDGFVIRTDVKVTRAPDRYRDPRGTKFWQLLTGILATVEAAASHPAPPCTPPLFLLLMYLYLLRVG
jgi:hypothetical protein